MTDDPWRIQPLSLALFHGEADANKVPLSAKGASMIRGIKKCVIASVVCLLGILCSFNYAHSQDSLAIKYVEVGKGEPFNIGNEHCFSINKRKIAFFLKDLPEYISRPKTGIKYSQQHPASEIALVQAIRTSETKSKIDNQTVYDIFSFLEILGIIFIVATPLLLILVKLLDWNRSLTFVVSNRVLLIVAIIWILGLFIIPSVNHNPYLELYFDNANDFGVHIVVDKTSGVELKPLTYGKMIVRRNKTYTVRVIHSITKETLEDIQIRPNYDPTVFNVLRKNSYRIEKGYYVSKP